MDLHQYLDILDKKNDLAVIDAAASVNQEIPYIASETVKKGGKALLFKNPSGYKIPVAMNLFGSRERMSIIMRGNLEHQAERIRELLSFSPPSGMLDKMRMAYKLKKLADFLNKEQKDIKHL